MITNQELSEICKLTAELTQQKLKVTPHLDIGNFASELFGRLLGELKMHKSDFIRLENSNFDVKIDLSDLER